MDERYTALVAIDVDGTLLNSKSEVSAGAIEAIAAVRAAGILPVLASGRNMHGVAPYFKMMPLAPYLIGAGGGLVTTQAGEILNIFELPQAHLASMVEIGRTAKVGVGLHQLEDTVFESSDELFKTVLKNLPGDITRSEDVMLHVGRLPTVKITMWGENANLMRVKQKIASLLIPVDMTTSGDEFLEITARGVSKGKALALLAKRLNIPLSRVAAIGDQYNDVSMFGVAEYGIAMGNAPADVKSAADIIAPGNDEGGLAWALKNVVLKAWNNQKSLP